MEQDPKADLNTTGIEKLLYHNRFMLEAIFELLAEKGVLSGVEVKDQVKKLRAEYKLDFPRSH